MGCKLAKPDDVPKEEPPGLSGSSYGAVKTEKKKKSRSEATLPYDQVALSSQLVALQGSAAAEASGSAASTGQTTPWLCLQCGFMNKAGNQYCGGNGEMGCKMPAPGNAEGLAQLAAAFQMVHTSEQARLQLELAQLAQLEQYSMMGYDASTGSAGAFTGVVAQQDERWHCIQCGFWNRPSNTVCGGAGPMGCKADKPAQLDPFQQAQAAWLAQQAALRNSEDKWCCEHCGFFNRQTNTICGGGGPLGCKQTRPGFERCGKGKNPRPFADDGDSWVCDCGFVNTRNNTQCGGNGPLGCKKARAEHVASDLKNYREEVNKRASAGRAHRK